MNIVTHLGHVVGDAGIPNVKILHTDAVIGAHGTLILVVPGVGDHVGAAFGHLDDPGAVTVSREGLRPLQHVQGTVRG